MKTDDFEKTFWNYYLELEREYLEIEHIIPFDETNYNTFSYKYLDLLWAICSEIDVLFKEYIKIIGYATDLDDNGNPLYNMIQYEKFVEEKVQTFKNEEITCYNPKFYKKKIYPYSGWTSRKTPKWWQVYNKIKRDKEQNFEGKKAYKSVNQINVLNALGGLFQLNLYIFENLEYEGGIRLIVPLPESKLFKLGKWIDDPYKYIIDGKDASKPTDDFIKALTNKILKDIA